MASKNSVDMLSGPLLGKILLFALPLAASSILQQLFNSADVAVVGHFAGKEALAAVGSTGPIVNIIITLFVGMSVGANVVVGNLIGAGRQDEIRAAVHTVISLALASGVFLIFAGLVLVRPILRAIGTPDDVLSLAAVYLDIYFLGMPFVMLYNFAAAILRSKGDTNRPLVSLLVAGAVNVALNLLLVIVFHLGVAGVAIATVVSNMVSSGLLVHFLRHEDAPFRLEFRTLSVQTKYLVWIVRIGVPAGIQGMVFSFSNLCIQSAINTFGAAAMAGSAATLNYEYFTYFVVNAFGQAAVSFTSQNYGAHQFARCRRIFADCLAASMVITLVMSVVFTVFRDAFVRVYTTDEAAIPFALVRMLRVELLECLPGTYEIAGACLRAMGYSMLPSVFTLLGSCVLRVVWVATVFRRIPDYGVLMTVYPVTWIVTGALVVGAYLIIRRKLFVGGHGGAGSKPVH